MKKLTLDLDTLLVESFDTDAGAREHGTVHAHEYSELGSDCGASLKSCDGCGGGSEISCGGATDPCICDPFHPEREIEFG